MTDNSSFNSYKIFSFKFILLTGSKWHVGKLLPGSRVVVEVAVGFELHPLRPRVEQTVVDRRGDADLVAHGDGVACGGLRETTQHVGSSALHHTLTHTRCVTGTQSERWAGWTHLRRTSHPHHGHDGGAQTQGLLQTAVQQTEILQLQTTPGQ